MGARILRVTGELRELRQAVRLQGIITRVTRENAEEITIRVRTDKGEVDIRLPAGQAAPQEGDRVEITLQPTVTPRPTPEGPTPRPPTEPQAEARPLLTPVEIRIRPAGNPAPQPDRPAGDAQPSPPWPEPGSLVRLQPLPPKEAALIRALPLPLPILSSPEIVSFTAQIIAADAAEEIISQTLAITTPTPQNPASVPVSQLALPTSKEFLSPALSFFQQSQEAQQPVLAPPGPRTPLTQFLTQVSAVPEPLRVLLESFPAPAQAAFAAGPGRLQSADIRLESMIAPAPLLVPPGEKFHEIPALLKALKEASPMLQNTKASTLTGIITAITSTKQPVLSVFLPQALKEQSFVIQTPAQMPGLQLAPGTLVQFTPQPQTLLPQQVLQGTAAQAMPLSYYMTPEPWPLMEEIFQALSQIAPPAAQAMSNVLPNLNNIAQFGPAALFFVAAVRSGDLTGWLGDKAIDALRRDGRGGLVNRLAQEGTQISRLAAEPVSQDWRAVPLPMFWQNEIHKMALYYRQDSQDQDTDGRKGKQTRFIFDLSLSHMGKVQVDGLFRPARLDVVVRSESALSQVMQMDMRRSYANALKQTELTGELSFQSRPDQWVTITASREIFGVSA